MKTFLLCLGMLVAVCRDSAAGVEWLDDVPTALARARAENKTVLLDFTGSDWCGWCIKLKKEVFDQPEFAGYAKANLVMMEVDFPRHKAQSPAQKAANDQLAQKYGVQGFPTVILLNASGRQVGSGGYVPGGPKSFIESLEKNPGFAHRAATAADTQAEPDAKRTPPAFVPIAPAPPMRYGDLTLKAISGTKDRRMVLINNETLMLGETGKVTTHDQRVKVTVKEIRDDSVIILVDGKSKELILGGH